MRQIKVKLGVGGGSIEVDGVDISHWVTAVRILGSAREVPVLQVEIPGEIEADIPDGLLQPMDANDNTAILVDAIAQLDPAALEAAILSKLDGLNGPAGTTGEATKTALLEWAAGYGSA